MKNKLAVIAALFSGALSVNASIILNETFSYTDGALLGKGGWTITGTSVVAPLSVSSQAVTLATTGQDGYTALSASQNLVSVGTLFYSLDINVATAQATGDYFFHISDPAGTTTNFYSRVYIKSSGTGFVIGLNETSASPTYGVEVLSFATSYKVVMAWNSVTGATNDSVSLYVSPSSSVQGSNTVYVTDTWATIAEPAQIAAVNLRQGTGSSAPTLTVDNIIVATTFSEAAGLAAVPEPSSFAALAGVGALGFCALRRRRSV